MTAHELLATIEARGVTVEIESGPDGFPALGITPASKIADLLPEVQRFKPALIELLKAPIAKPFRRVNQWVLAPATPTHSQGATDICQMLQSFPTLIEAAHREKLPPAPLSFESPNGELWEIDNPLLAVVEIESLWSERARACARAGRDLTLEEKSALEMATVLLDGIAVRWDGEEWRDARPNA